MTPQPEADAARWFAHSGGQRLLAAQSRACAELFGSIYGSVGLMLRLDGVPVDLLSDTQLVSGFALDISVQPRISRPVVSRADAIPINDASIRLLLVHHVHELVGDDAALYQELVRLLAPGGLLALLGLNPIGRSLRWKPPPEWIRHWRRPEAIARDLAGAGLARARVDGLFAAESGLGKLAAGLAEGVLSAAARQVADGYLLVMRKPDDAGRIVSARTLINRAGGRVSNAAPSAGMRPANADR